MKKITILLLSIFATQLYGADVPQPTQPTLWDLILGSDFALKVIPVMIGLQILLYGLAEGLTRLSVFTETKWDNRVAMWLSQAAWLMGVFLGKFGYSTPKLVIEEKAKEHANKESK